MPNFNTVLYIIYTGDKAYKIVVLVVLKVRKNKDVIVIPGFVHSYQEIIHKL